MEAHNSHMDPNPTRAAGSPFLPPGARRAPLNEDVMSAVGQHPGTHIGAPRTEVLGQ